MKYILLIALIIAGCKPNKQVRKHSILPVTIISRDDTILITDTAMHIERVHTRTHGYMDTITGMLTLELESDSNKQPAYKEGHVYLRLDSNNNLIGRTFTESGRFFLYTHIDDDPHYSFKGVEIKTVHHLQNIFIDHTGTELPVNLKEKV